MSLFSKLRVGLIATLLVGLNPSAGASEPPPFPESDTGFAELVENDACLPSYILPCQDTSGNLVDTVAGEEWVPSGTPQYSRPAYTFITPRNGIEGDGSSEFQNPDASVMDSDGTSIALLATIRTRDTVANTDLLQKRGATGYLARVTNSGALWTFLAGTGNADYPANLNSAGLNDGFWHYIAIVINTTDNTLYVYTPNESGSADISSYGSLSTNALLRILDVGGNGMQVGYIAMFEGEAAEALGQDELDLFWAAAQRYSPDTATPAQIGEILSRPEPTNMWWHGAAVGSDDLVGDNNLADINGPGKEVASSVLDATTTEIASLSSEELRAPDASVMDVGEESISIIHLCEVLSYVVSTYTLLGKRENAAPNNGYELQVTATGLVRWITDTPDGGLSKQTTVPLDTSLGQVILAKHSVGDNESRVYTRHGASTSSPALTGTLTSTKIFSVGRNRTAAVAQRAGLTMAWIGDDADGFDETDRQALGRAFGYEW